MGSTRPFERYCLFTCELTLSSRSCASSCIALALSFLEADRGVLSRTSSTAGLEENELPKPIFVLDALGVKDDLLPNDESALKLVNEDLLLKEESLLRVDALGVKDGLGLKGRLGFRDIGEFLTADLTIGVARMRPETQVFSSKFLIAGKCR